jgi:hypothetical protein
MAAKPALVRQGVRNVFNQDFVWVWVQRPEPQAGKGANEAVETIHEKSGTRLAGPHNSLGERGPLKH